MARISHSRTLLILLLLCVLSLLYLIRTYSKPVPAIFLKENREFFKDDLSLIEISKFNAKLSQGQYENAAIATEVPICSTIGRSILEKHGSAVDATIAAAICIGLINNFSSGIGGGGFMLVRTANKSTIAIDFRETAPSAASKDMFNLDPQKAVSGALSIAVPGEILGLKEAHSRFGKLPWKDLFAPSIKLATNGFIVTKELARRLDIFKQIIYRDEALANLYAPNKTLATEGTILKRPKLAQTLQNIANFGPDYFYNGPLAHQIVNFIQKNGGIMTLEDLKNYKVIIRNTIQGTYKNHTVISIPSPASGAILLQCLNILEGYPLSKEGQTGLNTHRFVESLKYSYASRIMDGDPEFNPSISKYEEFIVRKEYANEIRTNISDSQTFDWQHYFDSKVLPEEPRDHGTTHVSCIDPDGIYVSFMSTVNTVFGSLLLDPQTDILFNNEMDDFSIPKRRNSFDLNPGPYNYIAPGKRPMSSSAPVIIIGPESLSYVIGGAGGSRIISATVQTAINIIDYNMTLAEAITHGRIHHQLIPNEARIAYAVQKELVNALKQRGHMINIHSPNEYFTSIQGVVQFANGKLDAFSDLRKGGLADGY